MYDRPFYRKPPFGTTISPDDPLASGLRGFHALNEQAGLQLHDSTHNLDLTAIGYAGGNPWSSTNAGSGLISTAAGQGAAATIPASLQLGWPLSFAVGIRFLGAPNNFNVAYGFSYSNAEQSPYYVAALTIRPAGPVLEWNSAGTRGNVGFSSAYAVGDHVLSGTVTATSQALYLDGIPVASAANALSNPAYSATSQLYIAEYVNRAAITNALVYWGGWWSRALAAGEHAAIGRGVNAIWRIFRNRIKAAIPASIVPGITSIAPSPIIAGTTTTVALVGYGTTWTPGTPGSPAFALTSPPAGTTITGQSVTDATHATVTISAGSTPGTVTITDGATAPGRVPLVAGSFTVSPASIPADHVGNLTLALAGSGTAWTSGTTFTLPAISGLSLVSKAYHSATSVSLVVATGSGTGTGDIADSTDAATAALTVAAAALACTPTAVAATGTYPLVLRGTGTAWTQETPSGLFTTAFSGATISGIAVQSDTQATATLALAGAGGGTLTIADTGTTATTTLAVHAVPSGSLHVAAPLLLRHTGGSSGLFGGKANVSLAFRFKANSNAGLNLATGITILDFATKIGANAFATHFPATGTLQLTAFSTTAKVFQATVPVQVGTDDHFALACGNPNWTLYRNGQPLRTVAMSDATYPYSGLMMGGQAGNSIAGTPQAMDHTLADVAIWPATLSATEAADLATGASSPLQVGGGAAAWWPLGGGTVGQSPVSGDLTNPWGWLADYSGGNNTLSVAATTPAGSLANATFAAAIPITSPLLIGAQIKKCGKLADFGAAGATTINGVYPQAVITALNGTPTIYRNGAAVQLGPPVWFPATADAPLVSYPLQCGGVPSIAIRDGGAGFSTSANVTITPVNAGTGGSGLTLGHPVLQSGVTGYTLGNAGLGYNPAPTVTIADSGGSGSGALAYAIVLSGQVVGVRVTNGGTNYVSPVATISGAGSGAAVTLAQSGGIVQDNAVMTSFGSAYPGPPAVTVGLPPGMAGPAGNIAAQARAVVYGADAAGWGGTPGAIRAIVPTVGGLLGCGQGYGTAPTVTVAAPASGTTATATAVVSNYIASVTVANPGSNYNKPPTFTIADTGGSPSRAASLLPMMSGAAAFSVNGTTTAGSASVAGIGSTAAMQVGQSVSGTGIPAGATIAAVTSGTAITLSANATAPGTPSLSIADVFTYDAPASWLTAAIGGNPVGGLRAASGAAMANWTGRLEGPTGGLPGFTAAPTMLAGGNHGFAPVVRTANTFTAKNKLHCTGAWKPLHGSGALLSAADNTPVSWTSPGDTVVGALPYGPASGNGVDGMGGAALMGPWTLQYDDPQVNTATATAAWIASFFDSANVAITPVMLSGPASPVVVPSGNITMTSGVVTRISLSGLTLGAGWQGVGVQITPTTASNPGFASATGIVTGGVPTAINVVTGGNYTTTPTVLLYGTKVAGSAVTAVFDFQYIPTTTPGTGPTEWNPTVSINVAQPQGRWNLGNPWLVAPDARTKGAAASIDRTRPLAVDDAVLAMLTTPTGRAVAAIRFMDATTVFDINPTDIVDGGRLFWIQPQTDTVKFVAARRLNTDPAKGPAGDRTYAWVSPKVYGPQAAFVQAPDPAVSISGTLTAGSSVVTGVASMPIMAGSPISGAGIPAGAVVTSISPGSQQLTIGDASLWNPLAAVATGVATLAVTGPGSIALPPGDGGSFLTNASFYGAIELRSAAPHGLSSGAYVILTQSDTVRIPFADGGLWSPGSVNSGGSQLGFWVTGPSTIATYVFTGGGTHSTAVQPVAATAEIAINWTLTLNRKGVGSLPYEYAAAMCAQAGCDLWLNLPYGASDATNRAIAGKVIPNIGPTVKVYIEHGNENWNFGFTSGYHQAYAGLISRLPAGTAVLGGNTTQLQMAVSSSKGYGLATGHAHDVFAAAWAAAGLDAARLLRVAGGQFADPGVGLAVLDSAQRCGRAIDHVAVAFYPDMPPDAPLVQAISPAGSAVAAAASLPADGINDLFRHYIAHSQNWRSLWGLQAKNCRAFGQPLLAANPGLNATATCAISGGAVASASLSAATPNVGYIRTPTVAFSGPPAGGTLAAGAAVLTPTAIGTVAVTNGGSLYSSTPTVTITGGGGTYTSASATVVGGVITAIVVAGSAGYTRTTDLVVTVTDANGSGATFAPTLAPTSVASVTVTNPGAGYTAAPTLVIFGGGSLAAGTYTVYYTFADGQGRETTVGSSMSLPGFQNALGIPAVPMPPWPPWAQQLNWYVGLNAAPGVCTFYQSVPRSAYASTYPPGTAYPFSAPIPAGYNPPPATNLAAANVGAATTLVCYEGSLDQPIPSIVPTRNQLIHDTFVHPSSADLLWGFNLACQRGDPTAPAGGATLLMYFEIFYQCSYPFVWALAFGDQQLPGDGVSRAYAGANTYTVPANQFATVQGGAPADGHDHMQVDTSPMFQAFRTWADATSPLPGQVAPHLTTPVISWPDPDPIVYGTALSADQLDATANAPGVFFYTPALGAILSAGAQTLAVAFTPDDPTTFTSASDTATLTVTRAIPVISWPNPRPIAQGTPLGGVQLDATATVTGTFDYTPAAGAVLALGPQTLSVAFTPDDPQDYTAASATVPIIVQAAPPPPATGANEWVETDADSCQLVTIRPADPTLCYADPDRCRQAPV